MSRIFQQLGRGYAANPVSIVAQIDGNTVFSGAVPTSDAPVPLADPTHELGALCFDWTEPSGNFVGNLSFSITATGGRFQLGATLAQSNVANAAEYATVYLTTIDGVFFSDPLTNVIIDGIPQTSPVDPELPGQWGWVIENGSTLTATLRVNTIPAPIPSRDP